MPSALYLALVARPSASHVLLADVTIWDRLYGFTSSGSGAYEIDWAPWTHPTSVRADRGLYRIIEGVEENGVDLVEQASVADVKTSGGYFLDAAGELLTVKTSGAVNPDGLASLRVRFTFRVGTTWKNFTGEPPYAGLLDGDRVPVMRWSRGDVLRGQSAYPSGDLSFINADGLFDYMVNYDWENGSVVFRRGGDGYRPDGSGSLAYSDYEVGPEMQIARPLAAGDLIAVAQLRSLANATDRAFPQTTVADAQSVFGTPALTSLVRSAYLTMFWGEAWNLPCLYLGIVTTNVDRYAFCDVFQQSGPTIVAVRAVDRATGVETALVEGPLNDYVAAVPHTHIDVSNLLWPKEQYEIRIDLRGDDIAGGSGSLDILERCDVPAALLDAAAFAQADLDNPARIAFTVLGGTDVAIFTTGEALLALIRRSTLIETSQGADGRFTCQAWTPSFDLSTLTRVTDRELDRCEPVDDVRQHPVARVTVRYHSRLQNDATTIWDVTSASTTEASVRLGASETEPVDTCLVDASDAVLQAARLQRLGARHAQRWSIRTGPLLSQIAISGKLRLDRARGPLANGRLDQVVDVDVLTHRLGDFSMEAEVTNLRGIGEVTKIVAPDGTPDWASASEDERRMYAFAAEDGNERVDGTDPATYHQAEAW